MDYISSIRRIYYDIIRLRYRYKFVAIFIGYILNLPSVQLL